MKKRLLTALLTFIGLHTISAQVGIGTPTPNETAILELKSTERGLLFPRMSSNQRIDITTPATGLHVFDTDTNSAWFFDGTNWVNYATQSKYGDVKSGIQSADHDGWILLDGRALSTLSTPQQSVATSLGLAGNLPDASDAYLAQNGGTMASVTGSNTTALTKANLPNTTFTGSTSNEGSHSHGGTTKIDGNHQHRSGFSSVDLPLANGDAKYDIAFPVSEGYGIGPSGAHFHALSIDSNGNHTHEVTVNSGGTSEPINIKPRSLTVNMFIYLGI